MVGTSDYDEQVKRIRAYNAPIIASFRTWLQQSSLSPKTINNHVLNIEFFTEYLVYYEPLKQLDQTESHDVSLFLSDWFIRKAAWSSVTSVKSFLATFKKFFSWMGDTKRMPQETVDSIRMTLKEGTEDFVAAVKDYWNEIDNDADDDF